MSDRNEPAGVAMAVDYRRLIRDDFEQRMMAEGHCATGVARLESGVYMSPAVHKAWEDEKRKYAALPGITMAAVDVLAERQRQMDVEGWTQAHDDEHESGEMAAAAACYALRDIETRSTIAGLWPRAWSWFKQRDNRRNLVRAAALLLAEIERVDRLKTANVVGEARLAAHQPSQTTTATPQGVASTDQLGGRVRSEKD